MFGQDLRYDHAQKRWLVFNGNRWRPDTDGVVVRLALKTAQARLLAAFDIQDEDKRKKAIQWAASSMSSNNLQNTLFLARHFHPITDEGSNWDEKPMILGVGNGVVDLATGTVRPGMREDRITMSTGIDFRPDATAPRFDQFMGEIFEGNWELIDFVHRAAGYTLTGTLREEIFLLLFGSGQNGKTKLVGAIQSALGDYAGEISFLTLERQRRRSGEATPDLATLPGKRFVTASEGRGEAKWDERRVKVLTGRDRVVARAMYKGQMSFDPKCVFWLSTNHRPSVEDATESFWRRIFLVPFNRYFTPEERDPDLQDKLAVEREGILAWLVRGAIAYQRTGLAPPEIVRTATSRYRDDEDKVRGFLSEACVLEEGSAVTKAELYDAYVLWSQEAGEEYLKKKSFGMRMGDVKGVAEGTLGTSRSWKNLRLVERFRTQAEVGLNGRTKEETGEEVF